MMQRWRQLLTRRKDPLQRRLERIPADSLQGMEAYLICPREAFARGRFGKENKAVRDERCGYTFLLDTSVAAEKRRFAGSSQLRAQRDPILLEAGVGRRHQRVHDEGAQRAHVEPAGLGGAQRPAGADVRPDDALPEPAVPAVRRAIPPGCR